MLWAPKTLLPRAQPSMNLLLSGTTAAIRLVSLASFEPLGLKITQKHITKPFLYGFSLFLVFRQTFLTGSDWRVEVFPLSSSRILIGTVW